MAQRNPLNDRYQGEGPQGKTRKSATKLKPKSEAASTVHVEPKPTNKQERKAARKRRDAQIQAKERERKRKAEERYRKEREAAGETIEEAKPPTITTKIKNIFFPPKKESPPKRAAASDSGSSAAKSGAGTGDKNASRPAFAGTPVVPTWRRGPDTPEYRRLMYTYYVILGIGIAGAVVALLINMQLAEVASPLVLYAPWGVTYGALIAALVLDMTKIKKIQRAHQDGGMGRKSPKQMKHLQEKADAAALLEESKKAQKELRRANSKIPFVAGRAKKDSDAGLDDEDTEDAEENDSNS